MDSVIPKPRNNESTICINDHVVIKWDRDVNGEDFPFDFIKMKGKIRKIANNGFVASFKLPVGLFPPDHFASSRRNAGRVFYTVELLPSPSIIEKDSDFSIVIIDNANQSYEAESLIPLTKNTQKYIVVGDQNQLGPNISNCRLKNIYYDASFFHRLVRCYQYSYHFALLDCQYRIHPMIFDYLNKSFIII